MSADGTALDRLALTRTTANKVRLWILIKIGGELYMAKKKAAKKAKKGKKV
jgi:hypothetical protein